MPHDGDLREQSDLSQKRVALASLPRQRRRLRHQIQRAGAEGSERHVDAPMIRVGRHDEDRRGVGHRGRQQHRRVGRQQKRRGEIIGMAVSHLRHKVGGGRGHDDEIGRAAELDMTHLSLVGEIEEIGEHLAPRQRRDRKGRDELRPRPRQHRHHLGPALSQASDQVERLVGRDPAADDQKDAFRILHASCSRHFRRL